MQRVSSKRRIVFNRIVFDKIVFNSAELRFASIATSQEASKSSNKVSPNPVLFYDNYIIQILLIIGFKIGFELARRNLYFEKYRSGITQDNIGQV